MTDRILEELNKLVPLTEAEQQAICAIMAHRQLRKNETLMREGDICRAVTFVHAGSLRLFHMVDGDEKTTQFFFERTWYTDYQSFLTGLPTFENVQAMEDCHLIQIKRTDLETLYLHYPTFERIGRLSAERAFLSLNARNTMLTNQTPEARYQQLIHDRPNLFQRIPQYHIASFLGIKPESLSRIRKRMANR